MYSQNSNAFCCAVLSLALQGGGTTPPQPNPIVTGTVHYGDTGAPAAGVRLWLSPVRELVAVQPDPKTGNYDVADNSGDNITPTLVSPDGTFRLKNVPPGLYLVHTFSPSYLSPDGTVYPTSNTAHIAVGPSPSSNAIRVEVRLDQATKPVNFILQRGGTIEGSVSLPVSDGGASGSSLAGLAINAERKLGPNTYARVGGAAHTDSQGRYQLSGLAPGEYIVFVGMGGNLPLYSPGTVRPGKATVVSLQGPATQHLDIAFPSASGLHRIEGSIQIGESEPVQNAVVRLYPTGEGGLTAAQPLTATRRFTFENVPDGDYTVELEFSPSSKIVGVDAAKGIVHMRMEPSAFVNSAQDVRVAGRDISSVTLSAHRRSSQ